MIKQNQRKYVNMKIKIMIKQIQRKLYRKRGGNADKSIEYPNHLNAVKHGV